MDSETGRTQGRGQVTRRPPKHMIIDELLGLLGETPERAGVYDALWLLPKRDLATVASVVRRRIEATEGIRDALTARVAELEAERDALRARLAEVEAGTTTTRQALETCAKVLDACRLSDAAAQRACGTQ